MEKLRVGFIGSGRIADMHYLGYRDNPKAEIYAVCDADQGLLQRRAGEWGVQKVYDDYRRLLDDPKVDAVEVLTPHHLHREMTVAALEAGKHVSVQKPIALNITDAEAMIIAADRSGRLFRVIENYRYYPPLKKAKALLDAGEIGEPLSIRIKSISGNTRYGWTVPEASKEWRSDPSRSGRGSIVFDHGQHVWSLARYFLGDVERVFAFIGRTRVVRHHEIRTGAFVDSPSMVIWKYSGVEKYGSWEVVESQDLVVRTRYYPMDVWVEITGSTGVLWVNQSTGHMLDRPSVEMYRDGVITGYSDVDSDYATSFVRAVHDFADAILEGRQSELTGPEGRDVLRLSLAILLSGREHREVRVDEITD